MPHATLLSGRALDGRYELHDVIGQGTFGRVYRGRDRRLARPVAIKVIKPWWTEDPDWARNFEREAQLMARVSHPGIVQIFDVGHADEGLYYVAELIEGESLADRLRRGPLAPPEARQIAEQLCRALSHAHAQRVVHRDVKPANVLITYDGRVKVGDFGIARLAEGSTDGGGGTIAGTPRYMAPEQAHGRPTTPATDVYGAGVVLYEMLAGRPPFRDSSAVKLALRHLHDPPPPLPAATPSALRPIVARALAKSPADRYQSGQEMADALARATGPVERWAPDSEVEHERPEETPRKIPATLVQKLSSRRNWNPSARRRYVALLATVLLIALGMLTVGLLGSGRLVRVPRLTGLSREAAATKLRALGLRPIFSSSYSRAPHNRVISQRPAPGSRASGGDTMQMTVSAGPAPVAVPQLVGDRSTDAQAILQHTGLGATVTAVPAPGVTPGVVLQQAPQPAAKARLHSTVTLTVAEIPRWRALTSFAGEQGGRSVPFRIRGTRWRLVYSMSYGGVCSVFSFLCSGPSARIDNLRTGASAARFDLGSGAGQTQLLESGPGLYEVNVTPGSDGASWSMKVEDYY
jgi:serine/threonine protein kinase